MTYKEQYEAHIKWQDKVAIMSLFHHLQMASHKKWILNDTAKYFDVAIGLVSENIRLAMNLEKVKHCELRKDAVDLLRKIT